MKLSVGMALKSASQPKTVGRSPPKGKAMKKINFGNFT
jgi:hypothetical protein